MQLLRFLLLLPLTLLRFIFLAVKFIVLMLSKIAAPFIGNIHWKAPIWVTWIQNGFAKLEAYTQKFPLMIGLCLIGIIASSVGGLYGYQWYLNRPGAIEIAPIHYQEATIKVAHIPTPTNYREQNPTIDTLVIDFGVQAAPLETMKNPSITEGIQLSPDIEGIWRWNETGNQLIFSPKKDWTMAQTYTIHLTPKKLLATTIKTDVKTLEFTTEEMRLRVSENEFYQDPIHPSQKKSIFHIQFNYPVDIASFEKAISLAIQTHKGKVTSSPKFSVMYNDSKMDAWIHSEPVKLPEDLSHMKLQIQKGVMSSKANSNKANEITSSVNIPGLYALKINNVTTSVIKNNKDKYEQLLLVNTSDGIKGSDLAKATTLWLLPQKHPDYPRIENYQWNTNAITEKILTHAQKLTFTLSDTEKEYEKIQSLVFSANPNRYIFAQFNFDKEMHSAGGYKIKGYSNYALRVVDYPNMLEFMSNGSILSLNGEHKVPVLAQNVPGMKLDIKRVSPNQLHHLVAFNQSDDFSHMNFADVSEDGFEEHFIETFTHKQSIKTTSPESLSYESVNLKPYFSKNDQGKKGVFLLKLQPWDVARNKSVNYTDSHRNTYDHRFIIITDLGIIVKQAEDSSSEVFIQSISTGLPVSGAKVSVIGKNGKAVLSTYSDISGHAHFTPLNDFYREKEPMMYLVEKGDDLSFLPLKNYSYSARDRSLNLSRFDIGGIRDPHEDGALNAYLFSDRNTYRPGETFHIASIVKANKWSLSLKGIPVVAEIYDSRNALLNTQSLTLDETGLNEISYTTKENSPTGAWNIHLYSINKSNNNRTKLGHTTVNIKEFEPDRLNVAIKIEPQQTKEWLKPEDVHAHVAVQNLFGTPAQNLRVSTKMTLRPAAPKFAPFADYHFYEDHAKTQTFKTAIEDTTTDKDGIATLNLGLSSYAPASYYMELLSEAFEAESGRSVIATSTTLISPYDYFIGAKADGDLSYIQKDAPRMLHLIAVNPHIQQIGVSNLKLSLIENTYISVLTQQSSGVYKYESKSKEIPISEDVITLNETGYSYAIPTQKPGNYFLVLKDEQNHTLYKTSFSVAGNANVTRSLERDAELKLKLSQKEYQPGEMIEVSINAPYTGSGLITIERDKVYAWQWFKTNTTNATQTIQLPKELEGNAYVNVQFVRDPNSNEIFTSPLSYGVVPFSIGLGKHRSEIKLESPDIVKPGMPLSINVSTQEKQKVIVFAVDEGILQIARYKFEDPLKFFFRKRQLSVDSLQILDLILPEFSKLKELSAPGGDLTKESNALNRHLNPFKRKTNKAVAYWSGITEVEGEKTFTYDIPDYFNGKLRIMAIALTPERIGATQTTTFVRDDFVLSPNAPYVISPKDEFEVALSVANNLDTNGSIIPITISATPSSHLTLLDGAQRTLSLGNKSEGVVTFKMRANNLLGNAEITFVAHHGTTSVTRKENLSIRPSVPFRTQVNIGQMSSQEESITNLRTIHEAYAKRSASVSYSPFILTNGLASYLENYPYNCSEQIISRAIPTLFLAQFSETNETAKALEERFDATLDLLRSRQNSRGGFGMWKATIQADPFVSAYTVQFLLEARDKGKKIPADMLKNANTYLHTIATDENLNDAYGLRLRAFSIYLLTRQHHITTNLLSTVQDRLQNRFGDKWKNELTALYLASSYKMLKMDKEANELLKAPWQNLNRSYSDAWWSQNYNDPLIQDATMLYLITKHFSEQTQKIPTRVLENMVRMLRAERYTTLSSGMSILALEAYAKSLTQEMLENQLSIKASNTENEMRLISTISDLIAKGEFSNKDTKITFSNPTNLPAWYTITQEGFDLNADTKAIKNGLEIVRTYTDIHGKKINKVTLGDRINVHISVRSITKNELDDIAIVDLIPGGFEIIQQNPNTQMQSTENETWITPLQTQGSTWNPHFADIREDRVILFGSAQHNAQEFVYQIKANSVGTFVIPSILGEAMYDRAIQALSPGEGTLTITAPEKK